MIFNFWKHGNTERVYINGLDCLGEPGSETHKAFVRPIMISDQDHDVDLDPDVGVELVVSDESVRQTVMDSLKLFGLLPNKGLEEAYFPLFKQIAERHTFTGGTVWTSPYPAK